MEKRVAILAAIAMCAAIRPVCADLVDDFNRTDGTGSLDSVGVNDQGTTKYSYTERQSSTGPDMFNVARLDTNQLRIMGTANGLANPVFGQASNPGLVTLTGYNNAYPLVSATVAFDQGTLNNSGTTLTSAASLTANRIGFILRAPDNINFNSPSNSNTQGGYVDAQIGPNGDILIRELKSTGTLTNVYSKNPFNNNANTDAKFHLGRLPTTIGGLPFDANGDGELSADEPFTLGVQIINTPDTGGQDFVEMLINGVDVTPSLIAGGLLSYTGGNASGRNSVMLMKNRVAAANTIVSDALFDNLDISLAQGATSTQTTNTVTTAWAGDTDGNWITNSNWTNTSAYGLDSQVTLGPVISVPRTVTLTAAEVAGTLNFSSPISYTLAAQTLTQSVAALNPATTTYLTLASATGGVGVNVSAGTHTINSALFVKNDSTFNVVANSSLLVTGVVNGSTHAMTVTGGGSASFGAVKVGNLSITSGSTAYITAKTNPNTTSGTSVVTGLSIGSGLKLDLTNNDLVMDYSNGGAADAAKLTAMRTQIGLAFANGAWTGPGLTSSKAAASAANTANTHKSALGYAEASSLSLTTFDGIALDADTIIVRYTVSGDSDLNGTVGSSDFDLLAANFGATGSAWSKGDFNYDGVVNALDFNALATNFGSTITATASDLPDMAAMVLVPEPVSAGVIALGGGALLLRRRRSDGGNRTAL